MDANPFIEAYNTSSKAQYNQQYFMQHVSFQPQRHHPCAFPTYKVQRLCFKHCKCLQQLIEKPMPMYNGSLCLLSQLLQCHALSVHQAAFLMVDTLSTSVVWQALPLIINVLLPSAAEFNPPGRALRL